MSTNTERKYDTVVQTPFKRLGLKIKNDAIARVELLDLEDEHKQSLDIIALEATAQIKQYCQDAEFNFDLPLHLEGTAFQKKVWNAIRDIPKGEVRTYGEIAELLNSSARAVGNACAVNPVPVIIPCHRVVAKNGFGGYAGETLEKSPRGLIRVKGWLLLHEGVLQAQVDGKAVSETDEKKD